MATSAASPISRGHPIVRPAIARSAARLAIELGVALAQLLLLALIGLLMMAPSPADAGAVGFLHLTQPLVDPATLLVRVVFVDVWSGSILDVQAIAALLAVTILRAVLLRAIDWHGSSREPLPQWIFAPRIEAPVRAGFAPSVSPLHLSKVSGTVGRRRAH